MRKSSNTLASVASYALGVTLCASAVHAEQNDTSGNVTTEVLETNGLVVQTDSEVAEAARIAAEAAADAAAKAEAAATARAEAAAKAEIAAAKAEAAANAKAASEVAAVDENSENQQNANQPAEVELRSTDGTVSVRGVISKFDEGLILIKTSYGMVGVENTDIDCIGSGCPPELMASQ